MNKFDINAKELSFNFDGYGSSSTIVSNDVGQFHGDAKYSNPATKSNVPVSPVNRLTTVDFSNDWYMKTCINKRIPETGNYWKYEDR
ncbi:MAG: hypothetical protein M3R36_12800 [Bacteroidota bacterium]|nr:hypothetical protein [Bacteroidota bacterium]